MFPLPYSVETCLSRPLQKAAAGLSEHALQSLGMAAFREGNVIVMDDYRIGVVEACNGLGMLLLFFALTTGVVIVSRRPWVDRVILLLSAIPIALLSNVARIVATSLLYRMAGQRWGDLVFHDLAGWLMMPLALGVLWLELNALSLLLVELPEGEDAPAVLFQVKENNTLQHARG
jgi:exosortase